MAQPQTKTQPPRRLVAFEDKSGEEGGRTMLDSQRVRQSQIVFGDNIGVDEAHIISLQPAANTAESEL